MGGPGRRREARRAADDAQVALVVEDAEVAGEEEALGGERAPGLVGHARVAEGHAGAADGDLADGLDRAVELAGDHVHAVGIDVLVDGRRAGHAEARQQEDLHAHGHHAALGIEDHLIFARPVGVADDDGVADEREAYRAGVFGQRPQGHDPEQVWQRVQEFRENLNCSSTPI